MGLPFMNIHDIYALGADDTDRRKQYSILLNPLSLSRTNLSSQRKTTQNF